MYSKSHLIISVAVGAIVAVTTGQPPLSAAVTVGYAAALGVGIDVDHFVIARLNTGDWETLLGVVRDPRRAVFDQTDIFEGDEDVTRLQRLLSHVLLSGLLVAVLYPISPYAALVSGAVLYVPVLSDLYQDVRDAAEERAGPGRL